MNHGTRHHIHTRQDAEELLTSKGYTIGRSYESSFEFYADSVETAKGMKHTPAMSIRVRKKTGELIVIHELSVTRS